MARRSAWVAVMVAAPLILAGGCAAPHDPMYGPNAPHNAFGQPVDPVYGTQLPGTYLCCGGRP